MTPVDFLHHRSTHHKLTASSRGDIEPQIIPHDLASVALPLLALLIAAYHEITNDLASIALLLLATLTAAQHKSGNNIPSKDFLGPIVWRVQILFGGQVTSNYRLRHRLAIVNIDQTPSVPFVPCSGRESKVIDLNDGILCDDTSINKAGYTVITPES
jgi:hypothetical protein